MWIMGVEKFKLKTLSTFVYTECLRLCRKACFAIAAYLNCSVPSRPVWRAANAIWVQPAPPPSVASMTVIINNTQEKVPNMLYMIELCIPQSSWNNSSRMGSFILNKIMFMTKFSFALWRNLGFLLPYWAKYKHPCIYKSSHGVWLDSSAYADNWGTFLSLYISRSIHICLQDSLTSSEPNSLMISPSICFASHEGYWWRVEIPFFFVIHISPFWSSIR